MISTRNKRAAAMNNGFQDGPLPSPTGTIDVGDRAMLCWVYAGLGYAPSGGGSGGWIGAMLRRRRRG
jgi:hypothetical protein